MSRNRKLLVLTAAGLGALVLSGSIALIFAKYTLAGIIGFFLFGAVGLLVSACFLLSRAAHRQILNEVLRSRRKGTRIGRKTAKGLDLLARDVKRTQADAGQIREEVNRSEFRIKTRVDAVEVRDKPLSRIEFRRELVGQIITELAAHEALKEDFGPAKAVLSASPAPTVLRSLTQTVIRLGSKVILACHFDESALWLMYAMPQARLVIVATKENATRIRHAVTTHGLEGRIQILEVPISNVSVPHHYEPWFVLPENAGPFDTVVLGTCELSAYPAPFVLEKYVASSASLVLPPDRDSNVVAAWTESGQVKPTDDPLVLKFL